MRRLLIALVTVALIAVVAYLVLGYIVYDQTTDLTGRCERRMANRPDAFAGDVVDWPEFDYAPYFITDGYEEVRFPSREQGIEIAGWYFETDPEAPAIVVVHGLGACKYSVEVLMPASMLHRNGFNVLAIDLRDNGDSTHEDERTAIGSEEYLDALGAFDWLVNTKGIPADEVGLLGNSLGGATAMNAFAAEPRVGALFLNSPFANLPQVMDEELQRAGFPTILRPAALLMARLVAGDNLTERSPLEGLAQHSGRPIFLVHSMDDPRVSVSHTQQLEARGKELGADMTVWYLPSAKHVSGYITYPEEFEQKMVDFFRDALDS
jgi:uncharacterized protein